MATQANPRSRLSEAAIAGVTSGTVEGVCTWLAVHFADLPLRAALLWAIPVAVGCGGLALFLLNRPKRPSATPVPAVSAAESRLTWDEVSSDIQTLLHYAREFHPDLVVGINRGGAIVGGIMAKQLQLECCVVYLLSVTPVHPHAHKYTVTEQWADPMDLNGKKVLLVDDAKRTGNHMKCAKDHLVDKYPGAVIGTAVLLELSVYGPGGHAPPTWLVNMAARSTPNARLMLPWDK